MKDEESTYRTLFRRIADNFKTTAHERGFQICDFEHTEAQDSRKQELEKLVQDQNSLRSKLLQWCHVSYGRCLAPGCTSVPWMSSESILRYGLPPSFLASVLSPSVKGEKKVRCILEELCDSANSTYWKTEDEVGCMPGLGGDTDAHPYVSFTTNLS
ncbi:hypothetical protein ACFE04_005553 [Oxalis oulophora]